MSNKGQRWYGIGTHCDDLMHTGGGHNRGVCPFVCLSNEVDLGTGPEVIGMESEHVYSLIHSACVQYNNSIV